MYKKAKLFTTTFPNDKKFAVVQQFEAMPCDGTEKEVVNIYPEYKYQQLEGFGGAFTDSAGYIYSKMSEKNRRRLLEAYYGEDGIGYTIGRVHLDSCDFSLEHYQAVSNPADTDFKSFSLAETKKHILPFLQDSQDFLGKDIPLMAAAWSPPDFMKDTKHRNSGGSLLSEYREMYADYLCHYIKMLRKNGANIVRMTTQNEPKAVQAWDSCIYTAAEEKEFIRDYLFPALQKNGLQDVEIFIWDHNKERVFERARDIIDDETDKMIAGIAFHWYSGDHFEALELTNRLYPNKKFVQSEACIEFRVHDGAKFLDNAQKYAHDIIGDFNNGMTAFYDWNMVLDEEGGPNHVGNFCDAPFLYHADTDQLEERAIYPCIGHFSKYIKTGARRVAFSRYCDEIEVTAFENPDGEIVAVLLNRTEKNLPVALRICGNIYKFDMPEKSIATFVISK